MTTTFRLDAITLSTDEGEVRYALPSDLTVLAGPTGVGKTTLLELVKFGLGGDADIADVAIDHVLEVSLEVAVGSSKLRLARTIDLSKRKRVRVTDLITRERLPDHYTTSDEPRLSSLLLTALGLPVDMKAAARASASSRAGARISFMDIFGFLYVPQAAINREIAHSDDSNREPKRKAVFELLFGLTDADILDRRSTINILKGKIDATDIEIKNVMAFLKDSNTTTREEAQTRVEEAVAAELAATDRLSELRRTLDPVSDRETQVLRDLLADAERAAAEAKQIAASLARRQDEFSYERRRIQGDIDRLARIVDAGHRLASIEFEVCPRCLQSLSQRKVPDGLCRVCTLPDPVAEGATEFDQYEARQLRDQLDEIEGQLTAIGAQVESVQAAEVGNLDRANLLTALLEQRTANRITPRLQAFADASQNLADARATQLQFEGTLRQWDRVKDIELVARNLRSEREEVKAELRRLEDALTDRREAILSDLSEEFGQTVAGLGVPGVTTASIDPNNYLPIINGRPWAEFNPRGGGIITATQVAYWASLLAVAQKYRDSSYPAFLLVDSPRLAVNDSEALSAALYRRLVALADMNRVYAEAGISTAKVQIIIADNSLPVEYRADYAQIDFSIARPTVATIPHPGPSKVRTLGT